MHVFICIVLFVHKSNMQLTECKHISKDNRQQVNKLSKTKPKSCKTFDIRHRLARLRIKHAEKRTVKKLVKNWWKKENKILKLNDSEVKFDPFVKDYLKLSKGFRYLFIVRRIYPFRYNCEKIQLYYKKSPVLFAVYWAMTQHTYLEDFLLAYVKNDDVSPKFLKIKAVYQILDELDENDQRDQQSNFQAINASLEEMLMQPREPKMMRENTKKGPMLISIHNLFINKESLGISSIIVNFGQMNHLHVCFRAATGLVYKDVTNFNDCILAGGDIQRTVMLIFLGLNGLVVSDDYVILKVGRVKGFVNSVFKTKLKGWAFDTEKLNRDLKNFRKNLDSWLEHLNLLKLVVQLFTKFEHRKLYNLDGINKGNYQNCIKQVNTANRYLVYLVLRIIDYKQKPGIVKTGDCSSLCAQNMTTARSQLSEAKPHVIYK